MIKIYNYGEVSNTQIFARDNIDAGVADVVTEIIDNVITNGDKALFEYSKRFDRADLTALEVTADEIDEAIASVSPEFIEIIREAASNIRAFHEKQVKNSFIINNESGIVTTMITVALHLPRKINTTKVTNIIASRTVSTKDAIVFRIFSEVSTITPSLTSDGKFF